MYLPTQEVLKLSFKPYYSALYAFLQEPKLLLRMINNGQFSKHLIESSRSLVINPLKWLRNAQYPCKAKKLL